MNFSRSTVPLGAIIGGTLAGVIVLILGGALVWYFTRKRKQDDGPTPVVGQDDIPPPMVEQADSPPLMDQYSQGSPSQRQSAPPPAPTWDEVDRLLDTVQAGAQGRNPDTTGTRESASP